MMTVWVEISTVLLPVVKKGLLAIHRFILARE
jgi:hypothetical protein